MIADTQLSLFNTSTDVGTSYKAGDWVKLRRKPAIAAHVKRGEVFKVNAVHPHDGSMQFWNPHISQWDFLYPEEVKLVPAPADSVSPVSTLAEVADTEYIVEIADTEYIAEIADTEYIAEIADTEYIVEVADDSVSRAISTYRPRGTARSGEYFRFSYRDGNKMRHIHIRGGNTDSPIAIAKVEEVRSLLVNGISPSAVAALLRRTCIDSTRSNSELMMGF